MIKSVSECPHLVKAQSFEETHLGPFVHQMFNIFKVHDCAFTQSLDVGSQSRVFSNLQRSLVGRIQ
jgi:hypothetical protein